MTVARPFVYINMATTADGKITSSSREHPKFTSAHDRRRMDRLRAEADAILIGAGTLRADDPRLHVRDPEMRRHRRSLGKPEALLRVLVSANARLEPEAGFFQPADGAGTIVATVEDAPPERLERLKPHAEIWQLGCGQVDLPRLLERLGERGVERLLVEGGGELNWSFLRADLVDEIHLTICPCLLGGRDAPTFLEGDGLAMSERCGLRLLEVDRREDELFCRYAVVR